VLFRSILQERSRVQHVREVGDVIYVRFFDYDLPQIRFNVLRLKRTVAGMQHSLQSIELFPLTAPDLEREMRASGCDSVHLYGGLTLDRFRLEQSPDVVAIGGVGKSHPRTIELP
jgi:hypothetical protein